MSDSTPLFFKRKSKPTVRARQSSPEPESNDTVNESPSTLATRLKNKAKRAKPKSRLSFGADEDEGGGEVFKVKKSNLSQRLRLGTHPSNIVPSYLDRAISPHCGPTYDQAYLNQLKASTPSSRAPIPSGDPYDADMSMDIGDMSVDISVQEFETTDVFDSSTSIPSESSIKVARERRERLRTAAASGEDDFISLSVVKRPEESQGPHPESRLMREEDELGEGDDEFAEYTSAQERIALGKRGQKKEASKRRDAMKEMIADAEETDEETEEWEQEQIRRGAQASVDASPAPKVKETYKPAPIPSATALPSLGPALARLTQQLTQLTTSHASNTTALANIGQERAEVDGREAEMRQMVEKAETKRAWFGQFREWVEGVAGFLDEKYPLLEKLEEEHASLLLERFDMIRERRKADDEDDMCIFMGVTRPQEAEETDELGRVVPKTTPTLRRGARLARHKRRHQNQKKEKDFDDEEGYSTDSSLPPSDVSSYRSAISSLAERAGQVLSDVRAEEFRDPGKGWWTAWREQYADSYVGAWGGLGVVSVWEFWVRLEIIGWDFIREPKSLDSFKWYQGLYNYSRPNGDELGPDGDLVGSMISTALIPRICKLVEGGAFDAYSDADVRRVIDLAEEVEASVERGHPKFLVLLKSVLTMFRAAISENEHMVENTKSAKASASFDPASISARNRFLNRRTKLLRNIIKWRKYSGERFGIGETISRLVEGGISDIARAGWDGGQPFIDQAQALVASIQPVELNRVAGT
ncbi:nineteen complex-related protein 2-domain-containing protein [Mycena maculata]|uniref:Nineteen complex-related protein 2-domain-containing protein n=1 Tax=Mycena maculata TaxID=230809 RepID=A0AAD7HDV6_9AGAR|nr:nineteen complex-related protein 2-domain-containing protein [Mycena maculata]